MDIKTEIKKLNKIFADVPENKKELVEGLIQNAAFMRVTLDDLQKEVQENGSYIMAPTGNGHEALKENPAQKAYTTMVGKYSSVIDQLMKLLPDNKTEAVSKAGDALMAFIKAGKDG